MSLTAINWDIPARAQVMHKWAHRYLGLGWNVMPIEAGGKRPRLSSWESFITNRVTPENVDEWWGNWPYANIALICGRVSGVVVLDIDHMGLFDWEKYQMLVTPCSKTARGRHYFFQYPDIGVLPNFSKKEKGFDVISDGKYIVLPPSEHFSGVLYEWLLDPWNENLATLPQWLIEMSGETGGASGFVTPVFALGDYFDGAPEGERNNKAAKLAGYLFGQDRDYEEVICTLHGWNLRNRPPLSKREIETVVKSVYKKHVRGNR